MRLEDSRSVARSTIDAIAKYAHDAADRRRANRRIASVDQSQASCREALRQLFRYTPTGRRERDRERQKRLVAIGETRPACFGLNSHVRVFEGVVPIRFPAEPENARVERNESVGMGGYAAVELHACAVGTGMVPPAAAAVRSGTVRARREVIVGRETRVVMPIGET